VKLLVGVLLLLFAFAGAVLWQRSWLAEAQAEREHARHDGALDSPESKRATASEWGRVIVGRPSGADPVAPLAPPVSSSPPSAPSPTATTPASAPKPTAAATKLDDSSPTSEPRSNAPLATSKSARVSIDAGAATPIIVQRGDSLSSVCQAHYGTSRKEIVQALAAFNKLKNADQLREGDTLLIPPLDRLTIKDR